MERKIEMSRGGTKREREREIVQIKKGIVKGKREIERGRSKRDKRRVETII